MRSLLPLLLLVGCLGSEAPPPPPVITAPQPAAKTQDTAPPKGANRPPRVQSIAFEPAEVMTGDTVRVVVKSKDPDNDPVDVDYQWFINGKKKLSRTSDALPYLDTVRGDVLSVLVSVSDGEQTTQQMSGDITVRNSPPTFDADPRAMRDVNGFRVKASDVDGDKIEYKLEGAPAGMTIDPRSGTLAYEGSVDEPGGAYKVTVLALDEAGARAGWSFEISLTPGSKGKKKAAKGEEGAPDATP